MAAERSPRQWVPERPAWWQRQVIYQIYPRSFLDTSGDGIGDLEGIRVKADYLEWLGIGAVWLSPIYPSPDADLGYDISDYLTVDPRFGTLEDFDALLAALHERGIKLILDLVPNHTSDQHPWFVESRSGPESPKHGWYVWRESGPGGSPPNNWESYFGSPAWSYVEPPGTWYLHSFDRGQPDLNWENPEVRRAMQGRHAVLARSWSRWVPRRRPLATQQGPGAQGQPGEPGMERWPSTLAATSPPELRGRAEGARVRAAASVGDRRVSRPSDGRRSGPAPRTRRELPRRAPGRGPPAPQFRPHRAGHVEGR